MALNNPVRETLRSGGAVGSLWLSIGSTIVAELCARAGADAIVIDLQHGVWDYRSLHDAVGLVAPFSAPLVRVRANSYTEIGQALDCGAMGVIVPMVETAAEAEAAVAAAKFPPRGRRSGGGVRPSIEPQRYFAEVNEATFVAVMIETATGLENAAAIARVPDLDCIFIGPFDLSFALGTFPNYDARHKQACLAIRDACRAAKIACGTFALSGEAAAEQVKQGFGLVALTADCLLMLASATDTVAKFDAALGRPKKDVSFRF